VPDLLRIHFAADDFAEDALIANRSNISEPSRLRIAELLQYGLLRAFQ
jgi:hypothetical protein